MKRGYFRSMILLSFLVVITTFTFGCSRGDDSSSTPFWATDFNTNSPYQVYASKVYSGPRCYIYLENGQVVSQETISTIASEFTNNIYPNVVAAYGNEPDVDSDPRIYILLSTFREPASSAYISSYFNALNEYAYDPLYPETQYSNQKEILFINIVQLLDIGEQPYVNALAHEFQHMIHWHQKTNLRNKTDDIWLDEAMSEVARTYCGYRPSMSRQYDFHYNPTHSLTVWDNTSKSSAIAYMWGQYFRDRFDATIFKSIMNLNDIGINSVNTALTASYGTGITFESTFRDWSIALLSGNTLLWMDHPEWSYTSINPSVPLAQNVTSLPTMTAWSLGFYGYNSQTTTSSPPSVTWTASSAHEKATFFDVATLGWKLSYDITSGVTYTYVWSGILITQNVSTSDGNGTVAYTSPKIQSQDIIPTPSQMLKNANQQMSLQDNPQPQPICIQPWFAAQEARLRAKGARP